MHRSLLFSIIVRIAKKFKNECTSRNDSFWAIWLGVFKDQYPNEKVGFSKFAELRTFCICTIHQNVRYKEWSCVELPTYVATYQQRIICNPPPPSCHLGSCDASPNIDALRSDLIALLDENLIDNKQWVSADTSTLETDEFVDMFCEKLCITSTLFHCKLTGWDCRLNLSPGGNACR